MTKETFFESINEIINNEVTSQALAVAKHYNYDEQGVLEVAYEIINKIIVDAIMNDKAIDFSVINNILNAVFFLRRCGEL